MSESNLNEDPLREASREEIMSALFAHLVIQNTNMALMFMGKAPNPQTGERMYDIEAARMFIDQLEMLEVKTKGNLSREEEKLLQQSLTHLRLTFVGAIENPPKEEKPAENKSDVKSGETSPAAAEKNTIQASADEASEADARRKFSKKY